MHATDLPKDSGETQFSLQELDLNKRQQKLLDKILNDPTIPDENIENLPLIGQEWSYALNHLITPSTANNSDIVNEISQLENDRKERYHSQIKETLNSITESLLR